MGNKKRKRNVLERKMGRRYRSRSRSYSRSRSRSRSIEKRDFEPRQHNQRRHHYERSDGPNPYLIKRREERNRIIESSRLKCFAMSPRSITDDSDDEKKIQAKMEVVKRERISSHEMGPKEDKSIKKHKKKKHKKEKKKKRKRK